MSRTLAEALRSHPVFFAPVPPPARTATNRTEERLAEVARLIDRAPRLDAIDVPELVDENHEGRPHYRTGDPRLYAGALAGRTGREVIVNKVVAHLADPAALEKWAKETIALGVRHAVLVGGNSRFIPYPGPPVAEANAIVRPILSGVDGLIGNIAIPQRLGEARRMLAKTRAGASFFTTQLVFDPEAVTRLIREYDRLCRDADVRPASILITFAPVADEADVEFVRWLGSDLPESAERAILNGDEGGASRRSIERAITVWREVQRVVEAERISVPLGVNVEQISPRHLEDAGRLLESIAPLLDATAPRAT